MLVPLVDDTRDGRIYDGSLSLYAVLGAAIGAVLLGWLGWALAAGAVAVAGLGQWASSGTAVGAFTGAGIGAAAGALAGALIGLYRIPARSTHGRGEH